MLSPRKTRAAICALGAAVVLSGPALTSTSTANATTPGTVPVPEIPAGSHQVQTTLSYQLTPDGEQDSIRLTLYGSDATNVQSKQTAKLVGRGSGSGAASGDITVNRIPVPEAPPRRHKIQTKLVKFGKRHHKHLMRLTLFGSHPGSHKASRAALAQLETDRIGRHPQASCWDATGNIEADGFFGKLFDYKVEGIWCARGKHVISLSWANPSFATTGYGRNFFWKEFQDDRTTTKTVLSRRLRHGYFQAHIGQCPTVVNNAACFGDKYPTFGANFGAANVTWSHSL